MIVPASLDLAGFRNGVYRHTVTIAYVSGVYDFTGFTPRLQLRDAPGEAGSAVLDLTQTPTANGSKLTWKDPTLGKLEIFIALADMIALPNSVPALETETFYYDLVMTNPNTNDLNVFLQGNFEVTEGVTR